MIQSQRNELERKESELKAKTKIRTSSEGSESIVAELQTELHASCKRIENVIEQLDISESQNQHLLRELEKKEYSIKVLNNELNNTKSLAIADKNFAIRTNMESESIKIENGKNIMNSKVESSKNLANSYIRSYGISFLVLTWTNQRHRFSNNNLNDWTTDLYKITSVIQIYNDYFGYKYSKSLKHKNSFELMLKNIYRIITHLFMLNLKLKQYDSKNDRFEEVLLSAKHHVKFLEKLLTSDYRIHSMSNPAWLSKELSDSYSQSHLTHLSIDNIYSFKRKENYSLIEEELSNNSCSKNPSNYTSSLNRIQYKQNKVQFLSRATIGMMTAIIGSPIAINALIPFF
jgi:hypothetical protein